MAAEAKEVIHANGQPLRVILQKKDNGYSWEISVTGKDLVDILPKLREANTAVKKEYGGKK